VDVYVLFDITLEIIYNILHPFLFIYIIKHEVLHPFLFIYILKHEVYIVCNAWGSKDGWVFILQHNIINNIDKLTIVTCKTFYTPTSITTLVKIQNNI
jgi:hypothetical protein